MPARPDYHDLITDAGRLDRSAVMAFAWRRLRLEQQRYRRAGIAAPPVRDLIAAELQQVWGWARAVRDGRRWGTLYRAGNPVSKQMAA
jgi:hypothetical protein